MIPCDLFTLGIIIEDVFFLLFTFLRFLISVVLNLKKLQCNSSAGSLLRKIQILVTIDNYAIFSHK